MSQSADKSGESKVADTSALGREQMKVVQSAYKLPNRVAPMLGAAVVSIIIHAAGLLGLAAATWSLARPGLADREHSVELVDPIPEGRAVGFQSADASRAKLRNENQHREDGPTLGELALEGENSPAIGPEPVRARGGAGLGELAVGSIGGSDIVPVGRGSGGGRGDGTGLGERDVTGGVGGMWGVGEGQAAKSVVYVMDRSGSMGDTFAALQRELMRAIGSLGAEQQFNVIWFSEGKPTELFERMKWATMDNKRDAFDAIKGVVPRGQTEPIEAVRRALQYKPDVMYLLSDGDFGDENSKLLSTIGRMNRHGQTVIHTFLFVYDSMDEGERILRQIAEQNRGTYKHVTDSDIRQGG